MSVTVTGPASTPPSLCGRILWLVGGLPGSGKTTVSSELARLTGAVHLDKDVVTRRATEALLVALGRDPDDRESETHRDVVKPVEYATLLDLSSHLLRSGHSVVADAPLVDVFTDAAVRQTWEDVARAAGTVAKTARVSVDAQVRKSRIEARGETRDGWKLAHWDEYALSCSTIEDDVLADFCLDTTEPWYEALVALVRAI